MSPVKIVLVILLVLALLYGLSLLFANRTEPSDPGKFLDSVGSSLGSGINSLSDRFGPGFDFKTVNDPHVSAKTRTITVPRDQTVHIRIAGGSGVQRLKFVQIQPDCTISYADNKSDVKDQHQEHADTEKTLAMTDQGGILKIKCNSKSQDCVLQVK